MLQAVSQEITQPPKYGEGHHRVHSASHPTSEILMTVSRGKGQVPTNQNIVMRERPAVKHLLGQKRRSTLCLAATNPNAKALRAEIEDHWNVSNRLILSDKALPSNECR